MSGEIPRWRLQFEVFQAAFERLAEATEKYPDLENLQIDGLIKRYELTFEAAWKTLKSVFHEQGYLDMGGPRNVLKQAFMDEWFHDQEIWLHMLDARNQLSHLYNEAKSRANAKRIAEEFVPELQKLLGKLEAK